MEDIAKENKDLQDRIKLLKELDSLQKKLNVSQRKSADSWGDILEDMKKLGLSGRKSFEVLNKKLKETREKAGGLGDALGDGFKGTETIAMKSIDRMANKLVKSFNEAFVKIGDKSGKALSGLEKNLKKDLALLNEAKGVVSKWESSGSAPGYGKGKRGKAMWSDFKGAIKGGDAQKAQVLGKAFEGVAGSSKGLTKVLSGAASGVLKSFSKLIPGIGWAIMAFDVLASAAKKLAELDKYRTAVAKNYMKVAGPQSGGAEGFGQGVSKYGSAIHSMGDLGVNKDEAAGFFNSIKEGGLTFDQFNKRVGSATLGAREMRRASFELGIGLDEAGAHMKDIMVEMRGSIDDVSDAFHRVGNDARRAGVDQSRFYNAVAQSTLAISTYGNFIKNTSKTLSAFTQTGAMSQTQAEGAAQSMAQMFSSMDANKRLAFLQTAAQGGGGVQGLRGMVGERISELTDEISKEKDDSKKQALIAQRAMLQQAGDQKDNSRFMTELANNMAYLSDKSLPMAMSVLEQTLGSDFFTNPEKALGAGQLGTLQGLGITPENFENLRKQFFGLREQLRVVASADEKSREVIEANRAAIESGEMTTEDLINALLSKDVDEATAKAIGSAFSTSRVGAMAAFSGEKIDSATKKGMSNLNKTMKDDAKLSAEGALELANQTTSMEEFLAMSKDMFDWTMADSEVAKATMYYSKNIAQNTMKMAAKMMKDGDLLDAMEKADIAQGITDKIRDVTKKEKAGMITPAEAEQQRGRHLIDLENALRNAETSRRGLKEGSSESIELEKQLEGLAGTASTLTGKKFGKNREGNLIFGNKMQVAMAEAQRLALEEARASGEETLEDLDKSLVTKLNPLGWGYLMSRSQDKELARNDSMMERHGAISGNVPNNNVFWDTRDHSRKTSAAAGGNNVQINVNVQGAVSPEDVANAIDHRFRQYDFQQSKGR